ncbi:hypothetical protein FSW04_24085 [Baekduia soli]|uniref:Uncharacterized protein n=1 Tax=Baekduia soli TaxID=496014 RepID=A0A5B8UBZ8_9ACTN|nr:hypothetical protein [Baekduia soli]QEC50358.1 hypothetical protein FSW04_24085 [Baekduia soli]
MPISHRAAVRSILSEARAEREALLERVSPELRASLPVDAAGVTQAMEHLAQALGRADRLHADQARGHQANPAVLHGRVYGRAPLSPETVLAAFTEGARVRAGLLLDLAEAIDGQDLRAAVGDLLDAGPLPSDPASPGAADALRAGYEAQEVAVLCCAERLDAIG